MHTPKEGFQKHEHTYYTEAEMLQRSSDLFDLLKKRRSLRHFSTKSFPIEVLENAILTASSAPSGANKQPWTFVVVADPAKKSKIRELAEAEEYVSYNGRMSDEWLDDLKKFDTNHIKEFLDDAPYLVVLFKKVFDLSDEGDKSTNYYVNESCGLAAGMFLAAVHNAGLASLTHTPSPMNFLSEILERPKNERPFLLMPVGYPAEDATVPKLEKKTLEEIMVRFV